MSKAATTTPLITLDRASLAMPSKAGAITILDEVSLAIDAGETVAMLGPSGAGKTTAMMVMAGLEAITGGAVHVAGRNLARLGEDELAAMRHDNIGIVFQAFRLIPSMTALENVAIPLELKGQVKQDASRNYNDIDDRARDALERVGLGHRLHHFPDQLSGGEQQRVAIARAIVPGPRILLADEPTGNLDQTTGKQIIDLLFKTAHDAGAALVLITHDERLAEMCGRIIRIADGRIASDKRNVQKKSATKKSPKMKSAKKKSVKKKNNAKRK